jgi:hypothetical protein
VGLFVKADNEKKRIKNGLYGASNPVTPEKMESGVLCFVKCEGPFVGIKRRNNQMTGLFTGSSHEPEG